MGRPAQRQPQRAPQLQPHRQPRRPQAGFSLIELMVALTIALFVLGGLAVLYINMKTSFVAQNQFAVLEDNERLASTMLTTTVRSAGYFPNPAAQTLAAALPASANSYATMAAGQAIAGTTASGSVAESLSVRYVTAFNDGLMNCIGQANTNAATPTATQFNIFTILPGSSTLSCSLDGGTTWNDLVSGVSSMSVMYSVDLSAARDHSLVQYLSASSVTSGAYWDRVLSAQVTLQFVNPQAAQTQVASFPWVITINLMGRS